VRKVAASPTRSTACAPTMWWASAALRQRVSHAGDRRHDLLLAPAAWAWRPCARCSGTPSITATVPQPHLMYGSKRPEDMLFRQELSAWWIAPISTASHGGCGSSGTWKNHVGLLPTMFDYAKIDPARTYAAVCGRRWFTSSSSSGCWRSASQEPDSHVARAAHEMRSRQMRAL